MGRLHAWEAAIGMATDNPLTGVGLNNFYYNYFYYSPSWDGLNHAVHSTWFGVLAETGFVGLIAFVTMVTLTLRSSITTVHKVQHAASPSPPELRAISEGNLAGLVGFCISGTFLTQGFTWPIYILLALSVAVAHYVKSVHSLNLT
jgi:O-antigen ligase